MQGKTHLVFGIASALLICRPQTMPLLVAGTGMAAVGGVISDIDSGNSSAHHDADRIIALLVAIAAVVVIADMNLQIGIYEKLLEAGNHPRQISIFLIFLAMCAFGKSTKHRSFMHSFPALIAFSACIWMLLPDLIWYFTIPFLSHLLLDLLTRRRVMLFWPSKKGYCAGFCTSAGWVNRVIFTLSLAAAVVLFFHSTPIRETGSVIGKYTDAVVEYLYGIVGPAAEMIRGFFGSWSF